MTIVTGAAAIYYLWITLFMVLPFGVQSDRNVQEGNDLGAPTKHRYSKWGSTRSSRRLCGWCIHHRCLRHHQYLDLTPSDRQAVDEDDDGKVPPIPSKTIEELRGTIHFSQVLKSPFHNINLK